MKLVYLAHTCTYKLLYIQATYNLSHPRFRILHKQDKFSYMVLSCSVPTFTPQQVYLSYNFIFYPVLIFTLLLKAHVDHFEVK